MCLCTMCGNKRNDLEALKSCVRFSSCVNIRDDFCCPFGHTGMVMKMRGWQWTERLAASMVNGIWHMLGMWLLAVCGGCCIDKFILTLEHGTCSIPIFNFLKCFESRWVRCAQCMQPMSLQKLTWCNTNKKNAEKFKKSTIKTRKCGFYFREKVRQIWPSFPIAYLKKKWQKSSPVTGTLKAIYLKLQLHMEMHQLNKYQCCLIFVHNAVWCCCYILHPLFSM